MTMLTMTQIEACRVYWGSHGCMLPRGHDGTCVCDCAFGIAESCDCRPGCDGRQGCDYNVGAAPYYGPDTVFYGEDAADRGLPLVPPLTG